MQKIFLVIEDILKSSKKYVYNNSKNGLIQIYKNENQKKLLNFCPTLTKMFLK